MVVVPKLKLVHIYEHCCISLVSCCFDENARDV